jgi:hypothetical protein
LSGNQEVSGFGDGGSGDTGDNWQILCDSPGSSYWERSKTVSLVHADTGKFLSSAGSFKFTQQNCGQQCPIMDQTEVSAAPRNDPRSKWQTGQGVYFPLGKKGGAGGGAEADEDDEL